MRKNLTKIFDYFLDMIFPVYCLGCSKNREDLPARERWVCPDCLAGMNLRFEQVCPACEKESESGGTHHSCRGKIFLDGLWAAAYYDDLTEKTVHDLKFSFLKDLSFPLSEIMIKSILETPEFGDFQDNILANFSKEEEDGIYLDENRNQKTETVLIPVPLHKKRRNWRGFNQSFLLSKNIGERFNLPVREDILYRTKNTKPQSKTGSKEERQKNIDGAFLCIEPDKAKDKNIILVDDICTTSATFNECAKELKRSGAKSVWGLVVARR